MKTPDNRFVTDSTKFFMDWIDRRLYHVPNIFLDTFLEDCRELNIPVIEVKDWNSTLYPGHVHLTEQHHLKKYGKTSAPYFLN